MKSEHFKINQEFNACNEHSKWFFKKKKKSQLINSVQEWMKSAVSKVYADVGRIRNFTPTICGWISSISVFFLNRNVYRLQLTGGSPVQLHRYTHRRELRQFTIQERFTLHSIRIQSRPHSADEHQQNITQDQNEEEKKTWPWKQGPKK